MSIGIFELVNGVLTKKKIAGKTLMDAQLNANSRNGVQNRIITGEINDIKDDISTISTQLTQRRISKTVFRSVNLTASWNVITFDISYMNLVNVSDIAFNVTLYMPTGECRLSEPLISSFSKTEVVVKLYNNDGIVSAGVWLEVSARPSDFSA